MTLCKMQPPWEFLLSASRNSLQSFELSRLNHAANLRKEIGALLDQWLTENSEAMLARYLMDQREHPPRAPEADSEGELLPQNASSQASSVSDNFSPKRAASASAKRGPV